MPCQVAGRKIAALGTNGQIERGSAGRTHRVPKNPRTRVIGRGTRTPAIRRNGQGRYPIRVAAGIPDNPLSWPPTCSEKTGSAMGPISAEPKESGSDRTGNPPRADRTSGTAERHGELANAKPHGIPLKRRYPRAAIQVVPGQHGARRVVGTALIYVY